MQDWFKQAKLGIFIHWGIYAVKGVPESWSWFRGQLSKEEYFAQADGFTARKYNPQAWAELFRAAGANYAVLTAKHHDGFALWDTQVDDLSSVQASPAGRDLIGPYCKALRDHGLHVGIYFSHLDWHHPDYASVRPHDRDLGDPAELNPIGYATGAEDPEAWQRFLEFHRAQLKELCVQYKPELLWFDGDWERDDEQWRMGELRDLLHEWSPGVILNSRMRGHGDYATPEQGQPIVAPEGVWEFCMTVNDSWGYQVGDNNWKSTAMLVRIFSEIIGMGGNLLLDVGPMADGSFQPEAIERLEGLGDWIQPRAEAIYPTTAGLPCGHFYGPTTLSADRKTLYLFQFDRPVESVSLKGIRNEIKSIRKLGPRQKELTFRKIGGAGWMNIPGTVWIDLPGDLCDENCTVLRVELEGELDLWRDKGQAIESN
ncbi:MAG: alpha-L-fucosidase [Phycisphaerae bacterium]